MSGGRWCGVCDAGGACEHAAYAKLADWGSGVRGWSLRRGYLETGETLERVSASARKGRGEAGVCLRIKERRDGV